MRLCCCEQGSEHSGSFKGRKFVYSESKSEAIPVAGRGGLNVCEMLRVLLCLDSRLTNSGNVVSPTHRPRSSPEKHYCSSFDTCFC
jgi:hypothetical protein